MTETTQQVPTFTVERPCEGKFDKSDLALRTIDNTTSQFSKKILRLQDTEITRLVRAEIGDPDYAGSGVQRTYFFGVELSHRQDWTPTGYGLGELISSISLLPNEELTLEIKTWETSKTQQDTDKSLESKNISDLTVEKSDVREVLDDFNKKTHHEFDAHASANWGWGSASANYGYSSDVAKQHKTMTKKAKDVARKCVNEVASKKTIKIAVSREVGSEEKTTRKISNINQCRTLNVNYYQIAKSYDVSLNIEGVNMLLFGPTIFKETWDGYVKSGWDLEGIMADALAEQALDTDGTYFQAQVLKNVIPRPDAILFTNDKIPKAIFAYEIIPDFKDGKPRGLKELVDYIFSYVSPASPPEHMVRLPLLKEQDIQSARSERAAAIEQPAEAMLIPIVSFLSLIPVEQFPDKISTVAKRIVQDYTDVVQNIGERQDAWTAAIPTNGIFAETMLGMCSGCEDYYEVQRQFDLELKQLEVERMKLANARAKLENERLGKDGVDGAFSLKGVPKETTLNLNVDLPEADAITITPKE